MKTIAASLLPLFLLSACGGHGEKREVAPASSNEADPMLNAMDGSALQAVGDMMNSPDAAVLMGGSAPKAGPTPAAR